MRPNLATELASDIDSKGTARRAGAFVVGAITFACGLLAIWWIMSDFSGEYYAQNSKLGTCMLDLQRQPTTISGALKITDKAALEIVEGRLSSDNAVKLSFAPAGEADADNRPVVASFDGSIDPPKIEQGSSTISFNQALKPYGVGNSQTPLEVTLPRAQVQAKVVKGVLTYNGSEYELTFTRNSLTSMFRIFESFMTNLRALFGGSP